MFVMLDTAVCALWMLTYLLVLIGTIKCRYPLISPMSQLCFGTNEFAVLLFFLRPSANFHPYVIVTYICWALIEIAIFIAIFKAGAIKRKHLLPYLGCVVIFSILLFYLIAAQGWMTLICYFNAFCGVLFWFGFMYKKEYPYTRIALAAFISKALADFTAIFVNIGKSGRIIDLFCVMLPLLDLIFVLVYFGRHRQKKQ